MNRFGNISFKKFNIKILKSDELYNWNSGLLKKEYSTQHQTTYWGDFLSLYYKATPYYISISDNHGQVLASLLMYKIGHWPEIYYKNPGFNLVKSILNYYNRCLSWNDGPIFFSDINREEVLYELLSFIEEFALKNGIRLIYNVRPPLMQDRRQMLEEVFIKKGYKRSSWATYVLNLDVPLNKIWSSFRSETRTRLRKTRSYEFVLKYCEKGDLKTYFQCEIEHGCTKRLKIPPKKKYDLLWDALTPAKGFMILSAFYEGRPIAFTSLRCFNKTVHILKPIRSKVAFEKKEIPVGDFLIWECIKRAKEDGFKYIDFLGVAPYPKNKEEYGIRQFKEKWGGDYYEYGLFSKNFS